MKPILSVGRIHVRGFPAIQAAGIATFLLIASLVHLPKAAQLSARLILIGVEICLLFELRILLRDRKLPDHWLWRMLLVSTALWMFSSGYELVTLLMVLELPSIPSLAHLFMLAGLIAATVGVGLYPVSESKGLGTLRDVLDVILLLLGSMVLFWMVFVQPTIDTGIAGPIEVSWLAVAPAFDLALALLLFRLVLLSDARKERVVLGLLTLAFLARLPSDVAQAYAQLLTGQGIGRAWQVGWLLTPWLMTIAANSKPRPAELSRAAVAWRGPSRLAMRIEPMLPAAMTVLIAGWTIVTWWLTTQLNWVGATATALMLLLLVARQGVIAGQREMRQHAALLQSAADLAFVCDPHGRLVLTNPAMRSAIGIEDPSSEKASLAAVMSDPDVAELLAAGLEGGWSGEAIFRDVSGDPFPVALSLRPLVDQRQATPLLAGTAHDLTEIKRREADLQGALSEIAEAREQLEMLNTSLESKVKNRTVELADTVRQLERMNEELQQLDLLKSEFVTLVSHELRGPLTNIRSGVELALRRAEQVPGSIQETLQLVSAETERLTNFVEIILDLSALEAGRFPLQIEKTPLPVIARTVASRIPADSGGGRIELPLDDSLPQVEADERSLMSVLFHLLDNALKYAPAGPVTVSAEPDHGFLRVSVADHGPGIAPQDRQAVFDQFRRLDSSDSRNVYGHGLGLYLSRRLVEAMGGRIEAGESASGGAEIAFWLPIAEP